jgi:hypothetical protein
LEQKQAFELAAKVWADRLTDNATINLHVQMANSSDLPNGVIGGALPVFYNDQNFQYSNYYQRLAADKTSVADNNVAGGEFSLESDGSWNANLDGTDDYSSSNINLTRANAKALGVISGNDSGLDGVILLNNLNNTNAAWQYNYSSSEVGINNLDYTTVAIHEIGHVLGFISSLDIVNTSNINDAGYRAQAITPLDLFRYDIDSYDEDYSLNDLTYGKDAYFSNIRGIVGQATFATGKTVNGVGDGYQASHWKVGTGSGIMEALLGKNTRRTLSSSDLTALDVIGWNVNTNAATALSNLQTQANNDASNKVNINRNSDIDTVLKDWKWARSGTKTTLTQESNLTTFLAQQGFFSQGGFWEEADLIYFNSTQENVEINSTFGDALFNIIKESFGNENLVDNLDNLRELVQQQINSTFTNDNSETETIFSLTQWLSNYDKSELNLDDLKEFLQQQEVVESVVANLS